MRRALVLLACLASSPALAVDLSGQGRVWAGVGIDTNPGRDVVPAGTATNPDGFGFVNASLEGAAVDERVRSWATYDLAGRKFASRPASAEDTLIQNLSAEALAPVLRTLSAGLTGRIRDRRGADREYSDLLGLLVFDLTPDARLGVRLEGGAHRFLFRDGPYSFSAPSATLTVRARLARRHQLSVFGNFEPRTFNANTNPNPADPEPPPPTTRRDSFFTVGAAYSYKGPFVLTAGYAYVDSSSNSFGETVRLHRLTATAGVRLPWKLTLLASGTLRLATYPEGIYYPSLQVQLAEDDENASSLMLKLVRPIDARLEVDLRYAIYGNNFPTVDFVYRRQVASVGLTFSF